MHTTELVMDSIPMMTACVLLLNPFSYLHCLPLVTKFYMYKKHNGDNNGHTPYRYIVHQVRTTQRKLT